MQEYVVGESIWFITRNTGLVGISTATISSIRNIKGRKLVGCRQVQFYADADKDVYKNKNDGIVSLLNYIEQMRD
jgi:hypothetical protein